MTDDETIDREDIIRYRLDKHILEDLRVAAAALDVDAWVEFADTHPEDTRFGWAAPVEWDDQITVAYCPEVLSLLTDRLDDNDFIIFMDTLEWMIDKHIVLLDTPIDRRRAMIEDELYGINPAVLAFLSGIELAFIGDG